MKIDIKKYMSGKIHFIGCGGAGMVGLVQIMHELGYSVSGSDMAESANTRLLISLGIPVAIGHSADNIPKGGGLLLVVRSSAVADDNPEYIEAASVAEKCLRRGEMLANVAELYDRCVAISGTHGKTSVTALLVHILKSAGLNPGYMIGGKVTGWISAASAGDGSLFITESDESDGTQVHLKSDILAVTNIEGDHSWSVGGEALLLENFAKIADNAEHVIFNVSESTEELLCNHPSTTPIKPDLSIYSDKTDWGEFQKENANIAVECAVRLGVSRSIAECEVRRFPGVARRMMLHYRKKKFILIEDYAHHPTEVRVAVASLRERFPDHRLRVVFQPHRYARLAKYLEEFTEELKKADEILIAPVFAAWQESGEVNSLDLAEKIGDKASLLSGEWKDDAEKIVESVSYPEVLAVFGAGDIEKIIPELILQLNLI
jgi:UDP-N-acetylmuramate--alanine ligase